MLKVILEGKIEIPHVLGRSLDVEQHRRQKIALFHVVNEIIIRSGDINATFEKVKHAVDIALSDCKISYLSVAIAEDHLSLYYTESNKQLITVVL